PWLRECQLSPSTHGRLALAANAHFPPFVKGTKLNIGRGELKPANCHELHAAGIRAGVVLVRASIT
ncbi:hypothetical protein ACEN2J_11490, partial [Pseudorhodobacter sp. W20_MBD10_FR17]|uniref:hypothetical protein n=1 Tax=Pseudorhodobacter sp. W20_MBD10_FR17 TaxID=3240266 RepID=UPI003F976496